MAKITLIDGTIIEGNPGEIAEMTKLLGGHPVVEAAENCYVKVTDRKPKAGDYVKFNEDTYDVTAGKYYEVTDVDCDGDIEIVDDVGDEFNLYGEDFEVYEKVDAVKPDSLAFKGAKYTLVQRKAQPGDVVVFTENKSLCVTNGKPYGPVVESRGDLGFTGDVGNTYDVYYDHYNRTVDNVKVYAPVADDDTLSVGNYAKVAAHVRHDGYAGAGDIVTLHSNDGGCYDFKVVKLSDTGDYTLFNRGDLVKATDEEVAEAKAKLAPKFNVGDYVKIIYAGEYGGVDVGEIGKVVEGFGGHSKHRVDKLDGSNHDYFTADKIEKVSAEEVAKIEAEAKLAEQFAKLGRKPGEIKKGDVVIVTSSEGEHSVGTIGFAREDGDTYSCATVANGISLGVWSSVELIAPVESRVDSQ